jgi:capsid portal protein
VPFFVGVGAVVGVLDQNIYGVPDYLGGMHALLLNESATLFRRRYYNNGAHAGFIFYTNDPNLSEADEERMQPRSGLAKGWGISGRCL